MVEFHCRIAVQKFRRFQAGGGPETGTLSLLKWVNVADYWNCDKANGPAEENPHDLSLLSSAAVLMAERIRIDVVDGEGNDIAKVLMAGRSPFRPMRYSRCLPAGTLFGRSWAWRLCASPHSLSNPHVGNSFDRQHDYQPFPRVGCGTVSCLWGICCSSRPRRLVGAWPRPRHCNSNCFQRGARLFLGTPTTPRCRYAQRDQPADSAALAAMPICAKDSRRLSSPGDRKMATCRRSERRRPLASGNPFR